ncbi:MAG: hypothetical protein ACRDSZ_04070 [Pseudonocardiaceae bacterium]
MPSSALAGLLSRARPRPKDRIVVNAQNYGASEVPGRIAPWGQQRSAVSERQSPPCSVGGTGNQRPPLPDYPQRDRFKAWRTG